MKYFLGLICSLFLFSSCVSTYDKGYENHTTIPNLKLVEANIWRGGQPKTDADWAYLKAQGIKTIIKLDTEQEGSDEGAKKYGMKVVKVPIDFEHQTVLQPLDEDILTALMNVEVGTFIHCSHGQDRTGLVVGVYRMLVDGWTPNEAYSEMKKNGFHPELLGLYAYWKRGTQG